LLLLDLASSDQESLKFVREVRSRFPRVAILALAEENDAAFARELLAIGVEGYMAKSAAADDLIAAVHAIARGQSVIVSPAGSTSVQDEQEHLTARQHEVLIQLAKGMSNRQIARALCVTDKAVELHLTNIFKMFGVHSRSQAIIKAQQLGLAEQS